MSWELLNLETHKRISLNLVQNENEKPLKNVEVLSFIF